ncbi:MAG: protease inhibitor I42 family protein [Weeksellaceae bacterium]
MKKYLLLTLGGLFLFSCGSTMRESWNYFPNEITLEQYSNLDFVKVHKGSTVKVRVEENSSTGYAWEAVGQQDCVASIKEGNYQTDAPEGMVGAAGYRIYEITGKNKGTCLIEFRNVSPDHETVNRKAIYFTVE